MALRPYLRSEALDWVGGSFRRDNAAAALLPAATIAANGGATVYGHSGRLTWGAVGGEPDKIYLRRTGASPEEPMISDVMPHASVIGAAAAARAAADVLVIASTLQVVALVAPRDKPLSAASRSVIWGGNGEEIVALLPTAEGALGVFRNGRLLVVTVDDAPMPSVTVAVERRLFFLSEAPSASSLGNFGRYVGRVLGAAVGALQADECLAAAVSPDGDCVAVLTQRRLAIVSAATARVLGEHIFLPEPLPPAPMVDLAAAAVAPAVDAAAPRWLQGVGARAAATTVGPGGLPPGMEEHMVAPLPLAEGAPAALVAFGCGAVAVSRVRDAVGGGSSAVDIFQIHAGNEAGDRTLTLLRFARFFVPFAHLTHLALDSVHTVAAAGPRGFCIGLMRDSLGDEAAPADAIEYKFEDRRVGHPIVGLDVDRASAGAAAEGEAVEFVARGPSGEATAVRVATTEGAVLARAMRGVLGQAIPLEELAPSLPPLEVARLLIRGIIERTSAPAPTTTGSADAAAADGDLDLAVATLGTSPRNAALGLRIVAEHARALATTPCAHFEAVADRVAASWRGIELVAAELDGPAEPADVRAHVAASREIASRAATTGSVVADVVRVIQAAHLKGLAPLSQEEAHALWADKALALPRILRRIWSACDAAAVKRIRDCPAFAAVLGECPRAAVREADAHAAIWEQETPTGAADVAASFGDVLVATDGGAPLQALCDVVRRASGGDAAGAYELRVRAGALHHASRLDAAVAGGAASVEAEMLAALSRWATTPSASTDALAGAIRSTWDALPAAATAAVARWLMEESAPWRIAAVRAAPAVAMQQHLTTPCFHVAEWLLEHHRLAEAAQMFLDIASTTSAAVPTRERLAVANRAAAIPTDAALSARAQALTRRLEAQVLLGDALGARASAEMRTGLPSLHALLLAARASRGAAGVSGAAAAELAILSAAAQTAAADNITDEPGTSPRPTAVDWAEAIDALSVERGVSTLSQCGALLHALPKECEVPLATITSLIEVCGVDETPAERLAAFTFAGVEKPLQAVQGVVQLAEGVNTACAVAAFNARNFSHSYLLLRAAQLLELCSKLLPARDADALEAFANEWSGLDTRVKRLLASPGSGDDAAALQARQVLEGCEGAMQSDTSIFMASRTRSYVF